MENSCWTGSPYVSWRNIEYKCGISLQNAFRKCTCPLEMTASAFVYLWNVNKREFLFFRIPNDNKKSPSAKNHQNIHYSLHIGTLNSFFLNNEAGSIMDFVRPSVGLEDANNLGFISVIKLCTDNFFILNVSLCFDIFVYNCSL